VNDIAASCVIKNSLRVYFLSAFFAAVYVALVLFVLKPFWESDDIGMSMIANGYGVAHEQSSNLLFSNVLLGWFITSLPKLFGVDPYSLTSYLCLWLIVMFLLSEVSIRTNSYIFSLILVIGLMSKPVLEPQFTITSGLFMLCSALSFESSVSKRAPFGLFVSISFALLSFIVRPHEAVYMFALLIPFVVLNKNVPKHYFAAYGVSILVGCVILSQLNSHQYQADEWSYFRDVNVARAQFTDFGAGRHIQKNDNLLSEYELSKNDIKLLSNWFLVDRELAKPDKLTDLLVDSGFYDLNSQGSKKVRSALNRLYGPYLLWVFMASVIALVFSLNKKLGFAWFLFIISVVYLAAYGRGHISRVYYPAFVMLATYGSIYAFKRHRSSTLNVIFICFMTFACLANFRYWYNKYSDNAYLADQLSSKIDRVIRLSAEGDEPIATWGGAFPYKIVYRINNGQGNLADLKLIGLGVSVFTPLSYEHFDQSRGKGLVSRYLSDNGLLVVASEKQKHYLSQYCVERLHGVPITHVVMDDPNINLYRAFCKSAVLG